MIFVVKANFLNIAGNATKSSSTYFYDIEANDIEHLEVVFKNKVLSEELEYTVGYDKIFRKVLEYKGISFATRTDGPSVGNTIHRVIN